MAADFFIRRRTAVSGGTDYAGTNNGTLNNSPGYAPAVAAQGFTFGGYNNVSIPDAPALNPTNGLTVEAWINENGAHYDHRDLVSKDGEGYDRQFILTISRDYGTFRAHVSTANGLYHVDGQTVVQPGTWYHVAMTYDAAGSNLLLYVNGQLEASGTVPGGAVITTTQPVRIGGGAPAGYQQYYFTGSIDEPAIYSRALSAEEIESLYAAGCAGKCKTDLDADGLPDAWEWQWFGNYSHSGSDLDASGVHTLLYDYQNNLNPNNNFNPAHGFYDFMHVKACAPCPELSWGFDVANYVPGTAPVYYDGILGGGGHFEWPGPPEFDNPWSKPMTFYRRVVTIETYVGWIGSSDDNGNFTGSLVTKTITTTWQGYPYYSNPWNLDQVVVDAQSDNVAPQGAVNMDETTDPSHSQDLRISGFPDYFEETTKTTFQASDNSGYAGFLVAPTGHNNISGAPEYIWNQENSPPPTVTPTEVTQYFDTSNPQQPSGTPDMNYQTVQLASRTTRLEDAVTWGDYMTQINSLLDAVPLTPRTSLTTREGPLYWFRDVCNG